ncbi:MAG: SsrA-binding protein [Candidatus Marinimicrobia bacterium]|nr:SsrA-binding protein [Candidatus Neomarinimicrobiota bacterium]
MGIKVVATNRKATHDYRIIEKYESGIVLSGTEIKSIRNNKVSIKEAYVRIFSNEIFVIGMNISYYENAGYATHEPTSDRKLLMHKKEIFKIKKMVDEKGKTLIPLRVYFKNGKAKLEFGLGEGKKKWDKRHDIKDKETKRRIDRNLKGKI